MSESVKAVAQRQPLVQTAVPRVAPVAYQFKTLSLAWRNMWRNWRRTVIALVAIVLGMIMLIFMDGLIRGSDQAIFGNAVRLYGGNVQVHAPGFRDKANRLPLLPLDNADAIVDAARSRPQVLMAAKRINTGGLISSREGAFPVSITAIEPTVEGPHSIQAEHVVAGRYLLPDDGDAVFIGQGLASLLHVGVGERVTLVGRDSNEQMRQRTMTVVGIYDLGMAEAEKRMLFITLPEAQQLYNLRDQVTEVTLVLDEVGQEKAVMGPLAAAFPGAEVDSWDTLRPEMRQTMDSKASVAAFFMFVVVLIASIGVLNLMLMAVFERTREMGVLAAVGLKGRQIMGLFLMEGTLIGVVGAVIGCGLGLLLIFIVQQAGGINFGAMAQMGEITALMGTSLYPTVPLQTVVNRGLTVAIITALASLYPAWQSSRQEPAEALHHV